MAYGSFHLHQGGTVDLPAGPDGGVTLDCRVLGPLEVRADGRAVNLGGLQRRAVMAVLLNAAGDAVSEDALIETLWGEQSGKAARNTVQSHVSRLRAALGASGVDGPAEFVRRTAGGYRVELEQARLDSSWARAALRRAREQRDLDPSGAAALLDQALALWRGRPFEEFAGLPGWGASGLAAAQAGLEELRTSIRDELYELRLALGEQAALLPQLEQATVEEPLRERLHRLHALALYRSDRPTEALDVLRAFRSRLADDSGLDPSADLERLERGILRQDPALASRQVPTTGSAPPAASTSRTAVAAALVGRDDELAGVLAALDESRLVTITGPGGVGKSRLAAAAVAAVREGPGAARAVEVFELAAVHDQDAVVAVIAQRLGVRATAGAALDDALVDYLRGQDILVVLDNCEHLLAEVASLVQRIVDATPQVSVLVTSRERLGLVEEQLTPLRPLPVAPEAGGAAPPDARVPLSPAAQLFVARARRTRPEFSPGAAGHRLLEDVCRRLDGLPLAIELAASQMSSLGLLDLRDTLDDRLDVLALPRHATLRAVVDRSYDLLEEDERELFEQLAVFDGGFTLEAVQAVAGGPQGIATTTRTLTRLVDASMVTAVGGTDGRLRYGLLETLRLYARERLRARGALQQAAERHGAWVVTLTEAAEVALEGPDERDWIVRLDAEFANVRTAWHRAVDRGDMTTAARISVALALFSQMHGQVEVWSWASRLAAEEALAGHELEVAVQGAAALACYLEGDLQAAEQRILAGEAAAAGRDRTTRDWCCTAAAHVVALFRGDYETSERLAHEVLAQEPESPLWQAILIGDVALARLYAGDVAGARTAVGTCSRLAEACGSPTALAWSTFIEGEVALTDDPGRAVELLGEALELARTVGSTFVEGVAMVSLLSATIRAGEHGRAVAAAPMTIEHWQRLGGMWVQQWTTLRLFAELLVTLDLHEDAAVVLAAADTRSEDTAEVTGADAAREAELRATIRAHLGDLEYERSQARGERLTRAQVVAYALGPALDSARRVVADDAPQG